MRAVLDCIPCIIRQGLNTARLATDDPKVQREILDRIMQELIGTPLTGTPGDHSNVAYRVVREVTGVDDPYYELKRKYNRIALELYPRLKELVVSSEDPLHTAVKLAAAGNVIDLGIGVQFDVEREVEEVLRTPFSVDHFPGFVEELERAERLIYIGDNAGEIVFDKVLIEEIRKEADCEVTFVVRGGPCINDALREDAEEVGMEEVARVIDTGSDGIGIPWADVSEEFKEEFLKADVRIAKGQGNFETLSERSDPIYFILKAKCEAVARELGVGYGEIVFKRHPAAPSRSSLSPPS